MKYKWLIRESKEITKDFLHTAFDSRVIAKLLLNRGIDSPEKAKSYLEPKFYKESRPEEIQDLIKAKDRIIEAINKKEKITIFGDYDVDGVTSTACLLIALRQFTDNIDFYIPNRLTEGYGLNNEAVKIIAKKNKKACHGKPLLITCDCGITNHKEVKLAGELGMDVIVTDHHSLPEVLPDAYAVLNPKLLPGDHKLHFLPGVGVAYKLAKAILEERKGEVCKEDLLDLVALGMIADLAPLVDENRYLVQIGLEKLARTEKIGLRELLRMCGFTPQDKNSPTTEHVGFGIAPRINAVGRLTDAALAVRLLTTCDLFEAVQIAGELESQNRQRQSLCESTLNEAVTLVSEQVDFKNDKCIVLAKDSWHHGVIGIVASRVVEKFSLPTVLIAIDKEQNIARGSGRSIEKLNIVDALTKSSKHLEKYGGHKAACGLSVKPEFVNDFIFDFKDNVNKMLDNQNLEPVLKIDMELPLSALVMDLMNKVNKLSPFGLGNPMSIFTSDEIEIIGIKNIGKNGQHLKLTLRTLDSVIARSKETLHATSPQQSQQHEEVIEIASPLARNDVKQFEALIWNHNVNLRFNLGDQIKIAYTPKLNNYNGETFIQLEVKDWQILNDKSLENKKIKKEEKEIEIYDFRDKTQELLSILSSRLDSVTCFAEIEQKNHLDLKTFSRNKIKKAESLVFLEIPPDEFVFLDIIKRSCAKKIYFAFTQHQNNLEPQNLLKRLIGMLKYAVSNKNSIINETELQSALGINRTSLAYALEILVKIGLLSYEKTNGELNINLLTPARQNFLELIEYNLLVSELKQILDFKNWLCESDILQIEKMLNEHNILAKFISYESIKV